MVAPSYTKPCYKPLIDWLLGTTIGSQGNSVMGVQWLQASPHQQWIKQVKICLKNEFPIITHWLVARGNNW